jgi:hypothetical protein
MGLLALIAWSAPSAASAASCALGPADSAQANAASLATLAGPASLGTGWEIYAPLIAWEIGTDCPPASPGFASALSRWQAGRRSGTGGAMDVATLQAMNQIWMSRRPFVMISARACPSPPDSGNLAQAAPAESYGGKTIMLRPGALAAYRAMAAAARRELPATDTAAPLFTLFSGFRSPDADAARCARDGDCQGVTRAACSAHRTGLAFDIDLGAAPGDRIDSADPANRLFISRGSAYRWLVRNAGRFGLVPYPFEPWHWEWTGERP